MVDLCVFEIRTGRPTCVNCGFQLPTHARVTTKRKCDKAGALRQSLTHLIETCPYKGDATGEKVGCGCNSMPKQDVFFCSVHGEAIRHKVSKREWDGIACIECAKPREKLSSH